MSTSNLPPRQHVCQSAGYWYEGAAKAESHAEVRSCLQNAYNHVENALYAERRQTEALAAALKGAIATAKVRSDLTQRLHGHPVNESWRVDADKALADLATHREINP
jgi:nucleotide-binding universal stress UspA family protein